MTRSGKSVISMNVYETLMSQAADKLTEQYDKVKDLEATITTLKAGLLEIAQTSASEKNVWGAWIKCVSIASKKIAELEAKK